MNKKVMIIACLSVAMTEYAAAQQAKDSLQQRATVETRGDSIVIRKGAGDMHIKIYEEQSDGNEKRKVEIYEGVFVEKVDEDKRTFFDALPFIPKKRKPNHYTPHLSGIRFGYGRLGSSFLSTNGSDKMHLNLSLSWEIEVMLFATHRVFKKNPHWGIDMGISWGDRFYKLAGNRALTGIGEQAVIVDGDETVRYGKSRFTYGYFHLPVVVEWQQRLGGSRLFFNIGPEVEVRYGMKSYSHIDGSKKHKEVGDGLHIYPVGLNLFAQAGYGNIGLYLRYSSFGLFQQDKGPKCFPYSFGIAWLW